MKTHCLIAALIVFSPLPAAADSCSIEQFKNFKLAQVNDDEKIRILLDLSNVTQSQLDKNFAVGVKIPTNNGPLPIDLGTNEGQKNLLSIKENYRLVGDRSYSGNFAASEISSLGFQSYRDCLASQKPVGLHIALETFDDETAKFRIMYNATDSDVRTISITSSNSDVLIGSKISSREGTFDLPIVLKRTGSGGIYLAAEVHNTVRNTDESVTSEFPLYPKPKLMERVTSGVTRTPTQPSDERRFFSTGQADYAQVCISRQTSDGKLIGFEPKIANWHWDWDPTQVTELKPQTIVDRDDLKCAKMGCLATPRRAQCSGVADATAQEIISSWREVVP